MERENTCYIYRKRRGNVMAKDDEESKHKIIRLTANTSDEDLNVQTRGRNGIYINKNNIIESIIAVLIAGALLSFFLLWLNLRDLPKKVEESMGNMSENIGTVQSSISEINTEIEDIKQLIEDESTARENKDKDIGDRIDLLFTALGLRPTEKAQNAISHRYVGWGNPYDDPNAPNQLRAQTLIAYSEMTNEQYSAQQLSDIRLLLPYQNNGQEVYFYGAFSESGQWTGNCITNVYENDKLTLITDAEYDNGKLLKCKQIFSYTLRNGQDVWAFSDRTQEDGFSSGVTWLYERTSENEYTKSFTMDETTIDDIFTGDQFREKINGQLCAFYHGNISDGFFNDETGDAYMVYFFEDGTVRLLYSGNFKDGTFNDNTGKSWYIVKEKDTDYMYAKGSFKNGDLQRSKVTEKGAPPLSLEDIKGYMAQRDFDFPFELRWAGFELI